MELGRHHIDSFLSDDGMLQERFMGVVVCGEIVSSCVIVKIMVNSSYFKQVQEQYMLPQSLTS